MVVREEISAAPDIILLKTDVAELKVDVAELKTDVAELKTDVGQLKTNVRELGVQFEDFGNKLDAIAELVTTTVKTRREVDVLGPRVTALEELAQVQKRVIQDHSRELKQLHRGAA
jgi:predicted RNase H-like nuclease (RuvC/YqgF family)